MPRRRRSNLAVLSKEIRARRKSRQNEPPEKREVRLLRARLLQRWKRANATPEEREREYLQSQHYYIRRKKHKIQTLKSSLKLDYRNDPHMFEDLNSDQNSKIGRLARSSSAIELLESIRKISIKDLKKNTHFTKAAFSFNLYRAIRNYCDDNFSKKHTAELFPESEHGHYAITDEMIEIVERKAKEKDPRNPHNLRNRVKKRTPNSSKLENHVSVKKEPTWVLSEQNIHEFENDTKLFTKDIKQEVIDNNIDSNFDITDITIEEFSLASIKTEDDDS